MRKDKEIVLQDDEQDKKFRIRQMPATQAQRFIFKLLLLLGGGAKIDGDNPMSIIDAIAAKPYDDAEELLNSLLSCCSIIHEKVETRLTPDNVDGFVSDFSTLTELEKEAFTFNNFFQKAGKTLSNVSREEHTIKRRG